MIHHEKTNQVSFYYYIMCASEKVAEAISYLYDAEVCEMLQCKNHSDNGTFHFFERWSGGVRYPKKGRQKE
jgi:hypothetical protein